MIEDSDFVLAVNLKYRSTLKKITRSTREGGAGGFKDQGTYTLFEISNENRDFLGGKFEF